MDKGKAVKLMKELGVTVEVDSDSFDAMLEHPTVSAFVNGEVTLSQALFVEEYLANGFNAGKAARAAKYKAFGDGGFRNLGSAVLANKKIKTLIARRIAERAINANEIIDRYQEVAGGSIGDFLSDSGNGIDLIKAKDRGKLHLIKEIQFDEDGNAKIKIRDQDKALDQLARSHGLFQKDNSVNLPPEVLALIGLTPKELEARADAYEQMAEWDDEEGEDESTVVE